MENKEKNKKGNKDTRLKPPPPPPIVLKPMLIYEGFNLKIKNGSYDN